MEDARSTVGAIGTNFAIGLFSFVFSFVSSRLSTILTHTVVRKDAARINAVCPRCCEWNFWFCVSFCYIRRVC